MAAEIMNESWHAAWDPVWDTINAAFTRIADELRECNPNLWWRCGHAANEASPFWAWASFNKAGVPGEEDVVLAMLFSRRADAVLEFTSDIARGDGEILADGPVASTPLTDDASAMQEWAAQHVDQALSFMEGHLDLLKRELC